MELFNNFNNITDPYVKAYNRMVVANNFVQNKQPELSKEYLEQFTDVEKWSIMTVIQDVKKRGWKDVKQSIADRGEDV